MPVYFYTAKSFSGQTEEGSLEAQNEHQLAQKLKSQGLVLIRSVSEVKKPKFKFNFSFSGISSTEKIIMTRNLGTMFSTGLPLVKSFDILAAQTKNKNLKNALSDVKERISKGESLSGALGVHSDIFSSFFQNMVKVGEESGTLEEIFRILSLQISKEHELKSKIKNAMIYPIVVLVAMVVVGIITVVFILPGFNDFFKDLDVNIPAYTQFLFDFGEFLAKQWYLIATGFLFFAIVFGLFLRTKTGKQLSDTFLMKTPFVSSIVKKSNAAFLVRSLSSLFTAGLPIVRSLEIVSETIGNYYFKRAITEATKEVVKGGKLSSSLKPYQDIFPIGVMEMIEVGEETGKTSEILKKLADFYEEEAVSAIEKISVIIEPALIIIMGLAVGLFAFSVIEPIYSLLRTIR
ncbi:MAG: type II secretion system F family protein [Candidatus Staskawiczbacteria bacterium]|nr:type II secretion system F family protein [Candidatus Staskawiczbacteria bacterium]